MTQLEEGIAAIEAPDSSSVEVSEAGVFYATGGSGTCDGDPGCDPQGEIVRLDPSTMRETASLQVAYFPKDLAVDGTTVWGVDEEGTLHEQDYLDGEIVDVASYDTLGPSSFPKLEAEGGSVWYCSGDGLAVYRAETGSVTEVDAIVERGACGDVAAGGGNVWVVITPDASSAAGDEVIGLDADSGDVVVEVPAPGDAGYGFDHIEAASDGVWATLYVTDSEYRLLSIDPDSGEIRNTMGLGDASPDGNLAASGDALWTWTPSDQTLREYSSDSPEIVDRHSPPDADGDDFGDDLAVDDHYAWVVNETDVLYRIEL